MKKLLFAAFAIGTMAACTKSVVQYEQSSELTLQPVAGKATKAAVTTTAYPTGINFNVWAWWSDKVAGSTDLAAFTTPYIVEGEFTARDNISWGGVTPYYWPTTGSLVFAGYSPADAEATSFTYAGTTLTINGYTQSADIAQTDDLMWFDLTDKSYDQNGTDAKGVPVVFKHALSWLTFKFNLKTGVTPENWTVKSVKLTGIETKADFTAEKGNNPAWANWAVPEEVEVYGGSETVQYTADGTVLESTPNGVVVIPQSCASADAKLVITYDLKTPYGGTLSGQEVTLDLNAGADGNAWRPGKHYIYTIIFGANEILIAPAVAEWTEVKVEIPVQ